jgi:uncharacterized membrane protein YfcA
MNSLVLLTFGVSFLASILSGISGGGAGFIMMPYLILLGLTPQQALATSKLQSLGISIGAITAFNGKNLVSRKLIWPLIIITTISAVGSSLLVPKLDGMLFGKAVGVLLIVLVPTLFINKAAFLPGNRSTKWLTFGYIAFTVFTILQTLMGAGLGSMIVLVLMFLFGLRALEAQATKRIAQIVQAVIMFVMLVAQGMVVFSHGASGFAGSVAGCYIGTHIAIKKDDKLIKVVLAFTMLISGIALLWPAKPYIMH